MAEVVGAALHELLELLLGSAYQEVAVWHALVVETLGIEQCCCSTFVSVIDEVGARLLSGLRSLNVRAYRWRSECSSFPCDVPSAWLRAATEVLVRQLLLQAV